MRRLALWPVLLIAVLLAACSSTPPRVARNESGESASSGAWRTHPPGFPNFVDHSVGREEISIQAMGLVGIPYRWGGNTPDSGFDCSGLVKYVVARAASISLPRTTADMSRFGVPVEPDDIAAGDLVFFNTDGRPYSHVGIYVGKLRFVNAPSTGGTVRLDYLNNPYWARHFDGIRRVAPPRRPAAPFDAPEYQAAAPAADTAVAAAAQAPVAAAVQAPVAPQPDGGAIAGGGAAATPANAAAMPVPVMAAAGTAPPIRQPGTAPADAPITQARIATPPPAPAVSAPPPAANPAPDAIDAAADAFEPPPPADVARRQAAAAAGREAPAEPPVQILRASTVPSAVPAPTQTTDDPIAHFANY